MVNVLLLAGMVAAVHHSLLASLGWGEQSGNAHFLHDSEARVCPSGAEPLLRRGHAARVERGGGDNIFDMGNAKMAQRPRVPERS